MKEGITFDDVLLEPKFSNILSRKDVSLKTKLTKNITLNIPVVSANMDTITESTMAIAMAEQGGIGIIHRFLTIEQQVKEVAKVKRSHNFIIECPYEIRTYKTVGDAKKIMFEKGVHSLLVTNEYWGLYGIVTTRDLLFQDNDIPISEVMTPIEKIISYISNTKDFSDVNIEEVKKILKINKLEKLPIIESASKTVRGLVTAKDILNLSKYPNASKDNKGRLLVGAAIGVKNDYLERTSELVKAGVDVLVIDIAHGHSQLLLDTLHKLKSEFPNIDIIAGNVATKQGAKDLISAGADAIKAGIGGGCFAAGTRVLMSNGSYKNIEEIKIGDKVINKDGKPVTVLDSFSTGIKKVSKLRNSVFYEDTYVTPDHQYWVGDLNSVSLASVQSGGYVKHLEKESKTIPKQTKYKWKQIGETKQDTLLLPRNIDFELSETFFIQLMKRDGGNWKSGHTYSVDKVLEPSYELGYVFGTFLGDGNTSCCVNKKTNSAQGSVHWSFGLYEDNIVEKLKNCIMKIFNKEISIKKSHNTIDVSFHYKPLADYLNTFGKRVEKHLLPELLVNDKTYLKGILDGLIDSDGRIEKEGRINLTNTSKKIIELFNICCYLTTGVFPNNEKRKIKTGNLIGANIENFNQNYVARINTTGDKRLTRNYQVGKILEYSETDIEVPVYDITVDCETHSFIANNAIVHNSMCSTRIVTGCGVPQLTAIWDCCDVATYHDIPVISDGGIRYSGDITKALAAGASTVMLGGMLAGTDETTGSIRIKDGQKFKVYRGMASFDAAQNRTSAEKGYDINLDEYVPEGVDTVVPYKGKVKDILVQLIGGLRSGMSYLGVHNIEDMTINADFIKISSSGWSESKPHSLK